MKSSKENKKGVSIILIIIIVAVLIVGVVTTVILVNSSSEDKTQNDTITETKEDKNESTKKDDTSSKADPTVVDGVKLDGGIYKVPTYNIFIRVPHWHPKENGYIYLHSNNDDMIISIASLFNKKGTTLEQAYRDTLENYISGMNNYAKIDNLSIEKDEYVTINGIDMYKFEGKLNCHGETGKYDLYTMGYTFIMDGIPCCVQGTVYNKGQSEEMINTTRDTVNAMIKTLKDKI